MKKALTSIAILAAGYGALRLLDFAERHPRDVAVDAVMTVVSTVLVVLLYCGVIYAAIRGWRSLRRKS